MASRRGKSCAGKMLFPDLARWFDSNEAVTVPRAVDESFQPEAAAVTNLKRQIKKGGQFAGFGQQLFLAWVTGCDEQDAAVGIKHGGHHLAGLVLSMPVTDAAVFAQQGAFTFHPAAGEEEGAFLVFQLT